MSEETNIEWASHTGGPFLGCTEVSPGCLHCYARDLALSRLERIFRAAYQKSGFADWETRPVWGDKAPRVLTRGFWDQAFALNRRAQKNGQRARMFPSMIDWLDDMPAGIIDQDGNQLHPDEVLADFLAVVKKCESLNWLLLTKRPENWQARMDAAIEWVDQQGHEDPTLAAWLYNWRHGSVYPNIWIGTTVEDQTRVEQRLPRLFAIPARVRFLSCEPLLGDIHLDLRGFESIGLRIDWVICGGESGTGARPMHPAWARSLRDQCQEAMVPFFFKQWGAWLPEHQEMARDRTAVAEKVHTFEDGTRAFRVGKINAGALLDGIEHREFPLTHSDAAAA